MESLLPVLIIGLGNPGAEYEDTRHNAGFLAVDALLGKLGTSRLVSEVDRFGGRLHTVRFAGHQLKLLKPRTYMNESGRAVAAALRGLNLIPGQILVICDCMDLPVGRLRARSRGGDGGHRGLASIIGQLTTDEFPRLRIGIGRPPVGRAVIDHVLSPWTTEERGVIDRVVQAAGDAVTMACRQGVEKMMNRFNGLDWRSGPSQEMP